MSANIMKGKRFASRNGAAWWGAGTSLDGDDGKATTAVIAAKVGFPVYTYPMYYVADGVQYTTDKVAIVRPGVDADETKFVMLGDASFKYTPITNFRVAQLLDPLTEQWPAETCGALGKGEDFFITLNAGRAQIAGDEMQQYFFVWNKHDGTGALRVMFTPVRVVCQNTCIMGANAANVSTSVIHTHNVEAEAEFAINLTVLLQQAQQNAMSELAEFPKIRVTNEQIKAILEATYPNVPRDEQTDALVAQAANGQITLETERLARLVGSQLSDEAARTKAALLRLETFKLLQEFNEKRPAYANTGWAIYQAITDMESHRGGGSDAALAKSVMLGGERGKNMSAAYDAISALIPATR